MKRFYQTLIPSQKNRTKILSLVTSDSWKRFRQKGNDHVFSYSGHHTTLIYLLTWYVTGISVFTAFYTVCLARRNTVQSSRLLLWSQRCAPPAPQKGLQGMSSHSLTGMPNSVCSLCLVYGTICNSPWADTWARLKDQGSWAAQISISKVVSHFTYTRRAQALTLTEQYLADLTVIREQLVSVIL